MGTPCSLYRELLRCFEPLKDCDQASKKEKETDASCVLISISPNQATFDSYVSNAEVSYRPVTPCPGPWGDQGGGGKGKGTSEEGGGEGDSEKPIYSRNGSQYLGSKFANLSVFLGIFTQSFFFANLF